MSLNKLGDRQYLDKNLHGAKQHYTEALRIRQEFCNGAEPVSAELQLGIVTSLLKVLDIEQVSTSNECYRWGILCTLHPCGVVSEC